MSGFCRAIDALGAREKKLAILDVGDVIARRASFIVCIGSLGLLRQWAGLRAGLSAWVEIVACGGCDGGRAR